MVNGLPLDDTGAAAIRALGVNNGDGFQAVATTAAGVLGSYVGTIPVLIVYLDSSTFSGSIVVPPPPYLEEPGHRYNLTDVTLTPSALATYTEVPI